MEESTEDGSPVGIEQVKEELDDDEQQEAHLRER